MKTTAKYEDYVGYKLRMTTADGQDKLVYLGAGVEEAVRYMRLQLEKGAIFHACDHFCIEDRFDLIPQTHKQVKVRRMMLGNLIEGADFEGI